MYRHLYGLTAKPFQVSTDPAFLWLGGHHREALAVLVYGVRSSKGFLLLSGGVGTGKTTLIRSLLGQLDASVVVALVPDPGLAPLEFFNFIATVCGMRRRYASKMDFLFDFETFLRKTREAGRSVLLIVDEAQRLGHPLLEEIRLLSNIEDPDRKLLNIFFVGQEEFLETLAIPENRALKQRITVNYHLAPLTLEETEQLVRHRLEVAGATREIFTPDAYPGIFEFSRGAPRRIVVLCDLALLTGFIREAETIGADIIAECSEDLMLPGEKLRPAQPVAPAPDARDDKRGEDDGERHTAATVTAGMMLQEAPPRPSRPGWPRAAVIAILLVAILGFLWQLDRRPPGNPQTVSRAISAGPAEKPAPQTAQAPAVPAPQGTPAPQAAPETATPSAPATSRTARNPGPAEENQASAEPAWAAGVDARPVGKTDPPASAAAEPAYGPSLAEGALIGHEIPDPLPPDAEAPNGPVPVLSSSIAEAPHGDPIPAPPPDRIVTSEASPATEAISAGAPAGQPGTIAENPPVRSPEEAAAKQSEEIAPAPSPQVKTTATASTAPETMPAPAPYPTEDRLRAFIADYCRAYESLDIDHLRLFFAEDAVEEGRPFSEMLPVYRKNFAALADVAYAIELKSWKEDKATGRVTFEGVFDIRYRRPEQEWRTAEGEISMDLVSIGSVYQVRRLDYKKELSD